MTNYNQQYPPQREKTLEANAKQNRWLMSKVQPTILPNGSSWALRGCESTIKTVVRNYIHTLLKENKKQISGGKSSFHIQCVIWKNTINKTSLLSKRKTNGTKITSRTIHRQTASEQETISGLRHISERLTRSS